MARHQVGDFVAVINKFQRCGKIVSIDEKGKGYKVNTGKDTVFFYEKDTVLISTSSSTNVNVAMQKINQTVGNSSWFSDDFCKSVKEFLSNDSGLARAFGDYIAKVHGDVLDACLKAIKDSGLELPQSINIILFNINFIQGG